VWKQANPALTGRDRFLSMEYLENEFRLAEALPARQNAFRQLFLNQWVSQEDRWIDMALWQQCHGHPIVASDCDGRKIFGGLDLSAVSDLTALIWLTPCRVTDGAYDVHARFFLPESALERHRNADLYRCFNRDGWLTVTPGNVIDYRLVQAAVVEASKRSELSSLNIDARFQGIQVATTLADQGITTTEMAQTHAAYAASMREFERLLKAGRLHHGGNAVLRWMAENVVVKLDSNGDLKPDKARSHEKIDGICAVAMALDGVIRAQQKREPSFQMIFLGGGPSRWP
jgi:phage terminase large subunit-like protein